MKRNIVYIFLLSFWPLSCIDLFPEPHSLKYRDKEFNELANFILTQTDVFEMDDFTRHYKSLNGVFVKLTDKEGNQKAQFLHIVEDSLNLDSKIVSALRGKLEHTKLRSFIKSRDTILFRVDGFLDDEWGFMYARQGLTNDSTWFEFMGNSVKFVEDINQNWKRAAID